MKIKIQRYIKRKFIRMLSSLFGEIQAEYYNRKWIEIANSFKSLGVNCNVSYPYFISNPNKIIIGNNFYAFNNLRLEAITNYGKQKFDPKIIIGDNVSIQANCHIGAINKIIIEDNVMIASNIYISDHLHGYINVDDLYVEPVKRDLYSRGVVTIGKNVWIGDSVCIMSGVSIGENSIVGANSVVTKSFPANVVIAGVPAKIIKYLV